MPYFYICRKKSISKMSQILHCIYLLISGDMYRMHDRACVAIRGQPVGAWCLFPPGGSQGFNSGCQAWKQVLLPTSEIIPLKVRF